MHLDKAVVVVLVSLISLSFVYRGKGDDSNATSLRENDALIKSDQWWSEEDTLFSTSGICSGKNSSFLETCSSREVVDNLYSLRRVQCFCDDACHIYHDCCVDIMFKEDIIYKRNWTCRELMGEYAFNLPIYVFQMCPTEWTDLYIRSLCEVEAVTLHRKKEQFSYLQDIPVKSERTGIFYRNIYCALCNGENHLIKWKSYFQCASTSGIKLQEIDFSNSVYNTRTKNFRHVKIGENFTNCRIAIEDFNRKSIIYQHGGRLCKPLIDTCRPDSDYLFKEKCNSFTSFVYELAYPSNIRRVYKNFHCALCNSVNVGKIRCIDPLYPQIFSGPAPDTVPSLSFLFDFNFDGGHNQIGLISPCKMYDGQIWDPVLKQCSKFTCGILFERKGAVCEARITENPTGGLNNSCPKQILTRNMFLIHENGSVFVNSTGKYLALNEYETHERDGKDITSIAVCVEEGSSLLHLPHVQYWLSEITLSLSIICLILHLCVYAVLKDLRNCPGKILMSLSTCLICGHIFLLIGPHVKAVYWICYICGVFMHFGYLSSFLWMNVMAYDIYRTFSMTKIRNSKNKKTFIKYSLYSWAIAFVITALSVLVDNTLPTENEFRPKYGNPICWFNQKKGLLIFFIFPIFALLFKNVIFFIITSFRIRKVSQQTKMVNNFSDKVRYFLYIKLSIVFGLTWLIGLLAAILKVDFLWYPFILFNGLQGVFIFIAFTAKRKIGRMLRIKFKICSDKYKVKKAKGIKQAMYSSLSNLSTLQTTLTAHLPALNENPQILKAVRNINPDLFIEKKI